MSAIHGIAYTSKSAFLRKNRDKRAELKRTSKPIICYPASTATNQIRLLQSSMARNAATQKNVIVEAYLNELPKALQG